MSSPHPCFGEKTVIDVYPDDRGPGFFAVAELSAPGTECQPVMMRGTRRTVKVHCHECGETYLDEVTFPNQPE